MPLRHVGYRFEPGHRIRVSLASSSWPVVWPSPSPARFELHRGGATPSRLVLPVIPAAGGPGDLPVPAVQDDAARRARQSAAKGQSDQPAWRIEEDVIAGTVTVTIHDGGEDVLEDGRRLYAAETLRLTASDKDPASAAAGGRRRLSLARDRARDRDPRAQPPDERRRRPSTCRSTSRSTSTASAFFERSWQERIPRQLV